MSAHDALEDALPYICDAAVEKRMSDVIKQLAFWEAHPPSTRTQVKEDNSTARDGAVKNFTKKDIVEKVGDRRPDIRRIDASDVVTLCMDAIADALVSGARVELRGFGSFTAKTRKGRMARNPKTGDPVEVAPTNVVGFKMSRELRNRMADSYKPSDVGDADE
jgi:integration host factor subunit beta